jgi:hypothetical protein
MLGCEGHQKNWNWAAHRQQNELDAGEKKKPNEQWENLNQEKKNKSGQHSHEWAQASVPWYMVGREITSWEQHWAKSRKSKLRTTTAHVNLGGKNKSLTSELPSGNENQEKSCSGRCTPVRRTRRTAREHDGAAEWTRKEDLPALYLQARNKVRSRGLLHGANWKPRSKIGRQNEIAEPGPVNKNQAGIKTSAEIKPTPQDGESCCGSANRVEQDLRVVHKNRQLERTRPVLDGKQKYMKNVSDLKKAQREKWTAHARSKNPFFHLNSSKCTTDPRRSPPPPSFDWKLKIVLDTLIF